MVLINSGGISAGLDTLNSKGISLYQNGPLTFYKYILYKLTLNIVQIQKEINIFRNLDNIISHYYYYFIAKKPTNSGR